MTVQATESATFPFGESARRAMKQRGWQVSDLARQAGLPPASVGLVVTGHDVRLSTALLVAAALDLDTGQLGHAADLK